MLPTRLSLCMLASAVLCASPAWAELPVDKVPTVLKLDTNYPDSLIFAHDANFGASIAGRVVLVDVAAESRNYLGALDAAQFASFVESKQRSELYVAETFYSRGTRGDRTDVITIYDKENLARLGEIVLPGGKRGLVVAHRNSLQLIANDKFLLVFNFTPAASVTVIDIAERKVVNEVPIAGCGLIYPSGTNSFSSLCSNGSLLTTQLDDKGQVSSTNTVEPFFNIDDDPLFDKPAYIGQTAYFPTYKSQFVPIDLSGEKPVVGEAWSMLTEEDKAGNWRPGGWQIISKDDAGHLYVLMHPDGENGTHKGGGTEVWVFDPAKKQRIKRFPLQEAAGFSIEVTRGDKPYLVVTNGAMQLDIYQAEDGKWLKTIGQTADMPITLHAKR